MAQHPSQTERLFTEAEYLALERASEERHEYLDGHILNGGEAIMGLPKPKPKTLFTVDEYLAMERAATERHEYLDGQIFAMAGESGKHGDVSMNVGASIHQQLKGSPCRARTKDTKVRSGPILKAGETTRGLFSYPTLWSLRRAAISRHPQGRHPQSNCDCRSALTEHGSRRSWRQIHALPDLESDVARLPAGLAR